MDGRHRLTVRGRNEDEDVGEPSTRKRTSAMGGEPSTSRRRTRDPSPDANGGSDMDEYDPDQSMQERRAIQRKLRDLQKELTTKRDLFMKDDPQPLLDYIEQSNNVMKNVKQTAEAAIDSRGLVIAAELSARRIQRLTSGNVGNGLDVEELVGKCITFMRNGGGIHDDNAEELSSTQRRRRQPNRGAIGSDDEEDVGDEGDMLNWPHLGRFAAVPAVRRPALPGFLLGPLSIEKKARKITKRSAPFRVNNLLEVRPQELRPEDLKQSDDANLTTICAKIYTRLHEVHTRAMDVAEEEMNEGDEPDEVVMERHALRFDGGLDLLRFVVNPHSFGQTIENMFYVSFLIKEGRIKLGIDEKHGLPSIEPIRIDGASAEVQSRSKPRHQAIMSMDMATWRDIVEAFNINEAMIPHRREEEQAGPGARGWYS